MRQMGITVLARRASEGNHLHHFATDRIFPKVQYHYPLKTWMDLKNDGWADGYFEATAGAFAQEPFDRPDQGALPNRGKW
jgi:hypothetical protein